MSPRLRAVATYVRLYRWHNDEAAKFPFYSEGWSRHIHAATTAYTAMKGEIENPQNIDVRKQR